jgi:hypothetical protein
MMLAPGAGNAGAAMQGNGGNGGGDSGAGVDSTTAPQ